MNFLTFKQFQAFRLYESMMRYSDFEIIEMNNEWIELNEERYDYGNDQWEEIEVLKEEDKGRYILKTEKHTSSYFDNPLEMEVAYSSKDGSYIGDKKTAKFLCDEKGIQPEAYEREAREDGKPHVASIGFCEEDGKWYGWSHRAIFGFKEGMEVKKGDIAYVPANADEVIEDLKNFWEIKDDSQIIELKKDVEDPNGDIPGKGVWVHYKSEGKRGTLEHKHFTPYPEPWGRGSYRIGNEKEAKIAATNFAKRVS